MRCPFQFVLGAGGFLATLVDRVGHREWGEEGLDALILKYTERKQLNARVAIRSFLTSHKGWAQLDLGSESKVWNARFGMDAWRSNVETKDRRQSCG